ncbi:hypothetical protein OSTOST_24698, partial [Ostertagia ostertagi]
YTYGGLDTTNCGPVLAYQPLSSATYYQFKLSAVASGTYSSAKGWQAISDTGTSLLAAPTSIASAIADANGANAWILGDPFIRQYCNVYDVGQQQIGFANSLQK